MSDNQGEFSKSCHFRITHYITVPGRARAVGRQRETSTALPGYCTPEPGPQDCLEAFIPSRHASWEADGVNYKLKITSALMKIIHAGGKVLVKADKGMELAISRLGLDSVPTEWIIAHSVPSAHAERGFLPQMLHEQPNLPRNEFRPESLPGQQWGAESPVLECRGGGFWIQAKEHGPLWMGLSTPSAAIPGRQRLIKGTSGHVSQVSPLLARRGVQPVICAGAAMRCYIIAQMSTDRLCVILKAEHL